MVLLSQKTIETKKEETPATADITTDPVYQKGVEIVAASDCFTCHKIDEKNIICTVYYFNFK